DNTRSWVEIYVPGDLPGWIYMGVFAPTFTLHNGFLYTSFCNSQALASDYSISSNLGFSWKSKTAPYGFAYGGDFYCAHINDDLFGFISKKLDSSSVISKIGAHNYISYDNGESWIKNDEDFGGAQRVIPVVTSGNVFY